MGVRFVGVRIGANRRWAPARGTTILPIPPPRVETCDNGRRWGRLLPWAELRRSDPDPVPSASMAEHVDVVVVGAGPAGTAAAISAVNSVASTPSASTRRTSRATRRAATASPPTRSGCSRSWASRAPISAPPTPPSSRETVLVSPSGRQAHLPLPTNGAHAAVVSRRALDAELVARRPPRRRRRTRRPRHRDRAPDDGRTVRVDVRRTAARSTSSFVIAADGHWSTVRRAVGAGHAARSRRVARGAAVLRRRRRRPAVGHLRTRSPARLRVGLPAARVGGPTWGTACCVPTAGVAASSRISGPISSPARCCATCSARRAVAAEPVHAWPIPTRYDPARLQHGRVLFVGDAAGVVDPMTGEGIAQAIETGMLAAESIATGADYRGLVHHALGRDLRFAHFLQKHPAVSARCACRDPRRRPHALDPAQLRAVDVGGLSAGHPRHTRPLARGACSPRRASPYRDSDAASRGPDTPVPRHAMMSTMAEGKAEVSIDRSPDDVWKLVREFGGLETWMPGVETCVVDGDVRTIGLMGIEIKEQLRSLDDAARSISYSVIESPMGNLESHLATITVEPEGRRLPPHVGGRGRARRSARALRAGLRGLRRRAQEEARA